MKSFERAQAIKLRKQGHSIKEIATKLGVAKSSVSIWVRDVELTSEMIAQLSSQPFTLEAVEKRRKSRLAHELLKRQKIIDYAASEILPITNKELWLMGTMLYWAEGGKTRRIVRFSNSDPNMIRVMMEFFRVVCNVPEAKFRGYIHIHPHLDYKDAEVYWSELSGIPLKQFFKTYRKPNISSQNKKDSLPNGVMDIYVLDTELFLKITGWAQGIFKSYLQ